jgi:hypothetical protein
VSASFRVAAFDERGQQVTPWSPYGVHGGKVTVYQSVRRVRVTEARIVGPDGLLFSGELRPGGMFVDGGDTILIPKPTVGTA